jgi:hypothetical protein
MSQNRTLMWVLIGVGAVGFCGCLGVSGFVWLGHRVGPSDPPSTPEPPPLGKVAEWKRTVTATWSRQAYDRCQTQLLKLRVGDPMTTEDFRAHMGIEGTYFMVPEGETEPIGIFATAELGDGTFGFMTFDHPDPPITVYRFGFLDGSRLRQRAMVTLDRSSGIRAMRLSNDPEIELPVPDARALSGGEDWLAYLKTFSTPENFDRQIPAIESIKEDDASYDVFVIVGVQYFIDVAQGRFNLAAPGVLGPDFQTYDSATKVTRMCLGYFEGRTPNCRVWITTSPTGTQVEWKD